MSSFDPSRLKSLADLIGARAVTRKEDVDHIVSPQGGLQAWLLDLRPVMLDVEALDIITDFFWDTYEKDLPFQIGGMEVAAVPLVTALLLKAQQRGLKTNGFLIRKERKTTGLGKSIEGVVTDDPIILVDDIINSGASLDKARVIVEQAGKKPSKVFVIVDYHWEEGERWRERYKLPVTSMFGLEEFGLDTGKVSPPLQVRYDIEWRFYQKGAFPFHVAPKSTPLLVGNHVYMGSDCGKMFCIDTKNGKAVWEYDCKTTNVKGIWSSPAHHEGRIYFGAYNGNMYCLDAKSGKEIWKNPCCEWIGSSPLIVPEHGLLYIGLEHERVRMMGSNAALRLDNGERVWETGQQKYQHGSASYYKPKDLVIFGNADHDITAYNAKTGETVWKYQTERSIKYPPAIDAALKIVVATSFDGNIYVLNAESGEKLAAVQTDDICYTTPLITHGKIFAGSGDQHFYIIDAKTFEVLEKMNCYARVYSSPRLIDGHVVFGTNGGVLYEIDPETHDVRGRTQLPDAVTNAISASPDGGIMYASTHMNELYAIKRTRTKA